MSSPSLLLYCILCDGYCPCPTQDFALGDFDDTPIAKMEQEKEVAASQVEGVEAGTGEEQEDTVEDSGVAGLLRVVPETRVDAAAPQEPRKPLIEEV